MVSKNQMAIVIAVIGLLGAVTGGSFILDQSTTNTNISGDTNTFFENPFDASDIAEAGLDIICNFDSIPEDYEDLCEEWND